jgi:small-conductance mechanosensitive channel
MDGGRNSSFFYGKNTEMSSIQINEFAPIISAIGIIFITILTAWLARNFFYKTIARNAKIMQNDPTNYKFLQHVMTALIYIVGFSMAIFMVPTLKNFANSILAGAGILAVAIGFASQHALSNIISGLFIVIFKPFRVNDRLEVKGRTGIVEDITLRHTVIRDFENRRILIPNAVISDEVIINSNFGENRICKWIELSISFDCDIDLAKAIIKEEIESHPLHIDPRTKEQKRKKVDKVAVRVLSLSEYAVKIRGWAWARNAPDGFVMECDLYESIKKRFDKEGIRMALPYQRLEWKNNAMIPMN